ncbi:MAG: molybdate ABC transporter substrate-binding protein [Collinsella aerofaciens]
MDDAEAAELVDADTREDMFVNDLVIIRAEGSDTKVEAIADVANLDGKIAIGDAKTVPAGKYANQALASVGLYTGTEGDDGEYAPEIAERAPGRQSWYRRRLCVHRRLRGRFCLQLRHLPLRRH